MLLLAGGNVSLAQQNTQAPAQDKPAAPELSQQQRQSLAQAHERMAACLRSDRAWSECHGEMMQRCQAAGGCPMMGQMGGGRMMGQMGGGGMMGHPGHSHAHGQQGGTAGSQQEGASQQQQQQQPSAAE